MGRVNEKVTAIYTAQLVDETDTDILLSAISTLTLTLYDKATGTIINSRNAQNVLNAHNVTVSSGGVVSWTIQPADNAIVDDSVDSELHIALWQCAYGASGAKELRHEYGIRVVNLSKVT